MIIMMVVMVMMMTTMKMIMMMINMTTIMMMMKTLTTLVAEHVIQTSDQRLVLLLNALSAAMSSPRHSRGDAKGHHAKACYRPAIPIWELRWQDQQGQPLHRCPDAHHLRSKQAPDGSGQLRRARRAGLGFTVSGLGKLV